MLPLLIMTKSISDSIHLTFSIFLLVISLAYTFWTMTDWPDKFELVPSATTVFIEESSIPIDVNWNGTQVVAKLYQLKKDEVPIQVGHLLFETEEDVRLYQNTILLNKEYTQKVIINSHGIVSKIIFEEV